jgi:hypothetical protein
MNNLPSDSHDDDVFTARPVVRSSGFKNTSLKVNMAIPVAVSVEDEIWIELITHDKYGEVFLDDLFAYDLLGVGSV